MPKKIKIKKEKKIVFSDGCPRISSFNRNFSFCFFSIEGNKSPFLIESKSQEVMALRHRVCERLGIGGKRKKFIRS